MDSFFAFVLFIAGVYVIYAGQALKKTGKVNPSIMRTAKNSQKRLRDPEGFAAYLYPKVMLFGLCTLILGMWYLVLIVFASTFGAAVVNILEMVVLLVFFVVLFYYMHCVKVAEKRFCA